MSTQTAVATYESGPEQGQQNTGIAVIGGNWTPEEFMKRIEREEQMRTILKDYVKRSLKHGYHYDDHIGNQKLEKPMLKQEGARAIASIYGLFFGEPTLREEQLEDGHFRVRSHIGLFNQAGIQITSGDGLCTSREAKYAYRKSDRECPECSQPRIRKSKFPPRNEPNAQPGWYCSEKDGGCGAQFRAEDQRISEQVTGRVDNPDLADVENTVLKMAIKRAKVGAVCDIPTVSEIFAPDGSELKAKDQTSQPTPAKVNGETRVNNSVQNTPSPAPPSESQASAVDIVVGFVKKLTDLGEPIKDLKELYLPAGVTEFTALTEEQAADIRGNVLDALNAKLKQSN